MDDKNEIVRRMRTIINQLNQHNHLYYVMGTSDIGDDEYDQLRQRLIALEEQYPDLVQPDSPIQSVGGTPDNALEVKPHAVPMLSLGNVFNENDLKEFVDGVNEMVPNKDAPIEFVLEHKLDGLAVSLIYNNGLLTQAITRGDGKTGEDVTTKVKTIHNVPNFIEEVMTIPVFEVRGEVVMPKSGFKKYNDEAIATGGKPFANTRNAAAGSLRQKSNDKPRPLAFYGYSINQGKPETVTCQSDALSYLDKIGFTTAAIVSGTTWYEVNLFYEMLRDYRDDLPYDIDGMVIKVNRFDYQEIIGNKTREPKWAVAYKFPAKTVLTTLEDVLWCVGRMGQVTPVGIVTSVNIGGVVVGNVTLHNVAEIGRLGIKVGDTVTLERAGDVIPKITKVWDDLRVGTEVDVLIPTHCPSCNTVLPPPVGETTLFCIAGLECTEQRLGGMVHFASRECMDIDGLAEGTLLKLLDNQIIKQLDSIYSLHRKRKQLATLEGFGEKSINKLLESIENSKSTTLQRFIYSLGIRNVGEGTSIRLAKHYGSLDAFLKTSAEELVTIVDIGPITAHQIYLFLSNTNNLKVVFRLLDKGVTIMPETVIDTSNQPYVNQTWVITGSFDVSRPDIKKRLEELGANVSNSIGSKTDVLLAGLNSGSKLAKAEKLGIKILTELPY